MRIVATGALRRSFAEAGGSSERFGNKSGLAEPAVFVECAPRELVVRPDLKCSGETSAFCGIVHFASRSHFTDRRLAVALGADPDGLAITDLREIDWTIQRGLGLTMAGLHLLDVPCRWPMAHFTIDTWLKK